MSPGLSISIKTKSIDNYSSFYKAKIDTNMIMSTIHQTNALPWTFSIDQLKVLYIDKSCKCIPLENEKQWEEISNLGKIVAVILKNEMKRWCSWG